LIFFPYPLYSKSLVPPERLSLALTSFESMVREFAGRRYVLFFFCMCCSRVVFLILPIWTLMSFLNSCRFWSLGWSSFRQGSLPTRTLFRKPSRGVLISRGLGAQVETPFWGGVAEFWVSQFVFPLTIGLFYASWGNGSPTRIVPGFSLKGPICFWDYLVCFQPVFLSRVFSRPRGFEFPA